MDKKIIKRASWAGFVAVWLIFLDQITKYYAIHLLKGQGIQSVLGDVLCFRYLENTGGAFSLFHNNAAFMGVVTALTFVVLGFFVYAYVKLLKLDEFRSERIAIIFLFGGAAGNLIDRIMHQFVVDFIYVKMIDFPTFNVADCYITCAVFYIIIRIIYCMIKKKKAFIDVIL